MKPALALVAVVIAALAPCEAFGSPTTYASLDDFLGKKRAVPTSLAGYTLGQPPGDTGSHDIEIRGWGIGKARAIVEHRKVRHIVVELYPNTRWPSDYNEYDTYDESRRRAIETALTTTNDEISRRLGAGQTPSSDTRAQLFVHRYREPQTGYPSLVLNLLPPGDRHVCGKRDGFSAFFKQFRSAARRRDKAALSRMVVNDPKDDTIVEGGVSKLVTKLGSAQPGCVLSREEYLWYVLREDGFVGSAYIGFQRDARGVWTAFGPLRVEHFTNLELTRP